MRRMMMLALVAAPLLASALLAACGGSSNPETAPTRTPGDPAATHTPVKTSTPSRAVASDGEGAIGGLFGSVFQGGLSGAQAPSGLGTGDETLKRYLPTVAQLPDGYADAGTFTFSAPDGISTTGKMDIAAQLATKGNISAESPLEVDMIVSMVIRPTDLQEFGDALEEIQNLSEEELKRQIEGSSVGLEGFSFERFEVLDAAGLGDGGFGFEMTIDIGAVLDAFGGGELPGAEGLGKVSMRMYLFGRGDYMGATMRVAFADTLPSNGDEIALAQIIDGNLAAAP